MNIQKRINNKLLIIVLALAAFLRLWKLGSVPPHLTPDEGSLGYNAYSILQTAKDMHGDFLPIVMKSFGDYTPALYVYLTIPFVAMLGLTEFSVRLVSALSGVVAVYLIYLITNEIFGRMKKEFSKTIAQSVVLLAAVNPWLIYFSRGAWVPNLSLTLTLAGIYFFFKALDKDKNLFLSSVFFALSLWAYQGAKIILFLTLLSLIVLFGKSFLKFNKRVLLGSFLAGLVIGAPIVMSILQGRAGRLDVISIFSYPRSDEYVQDILKEGNEKFTGLSYYLFHSEDLNFARAILGRYFNHFSGRFLLFEGDWENPRHSPPYMGMYLFVDVLFIIAGLYALAKWKEGRRYLFFILFWLFLSPIPSALTRDQVHAVRSFHIVVPLLLIAAAGLTYIYFCLMKKGLAGKIVLAALAFFYGLNYLYYLDSYYIHMSLHNAKYWDFGYKQTVQKILPIKNNYEKIIVRQSYEQPFIYFLFYGVGESGTFQAEKNSEMLRFNESSVGDVGLVESLDNIYFSPISWPIGGVNPGNLVVIDGGTVTRQMIGEDYKIISEIKYPDNVQTAFWILEKV